MHWLSALDVPTYWSSEHTVPLAILVTSCRTRLSTVLAALADCGFTALQLLP